MGNGGLYEKNEEKALSCFRQSAAMNDPGGCDMLGRCYQVGIGIEIPKVFRQAFRMHPQTHVAFHWYMKALEFGGDDHAEKELKDFRGFCNLEKQGIPYDRGGLEPSDVLLNWKREFPETEAAFRKRFNLR